MNASSTLFVSNHPLVAHKVSKLRDKESKPKLVRELVHELASLLGYEVTSSLETIKTSKAIITNTGRMCREIKLKPIVGLFPVLRSGLCMVNAFLDLIPSAKVYHLGLFRDRSTLQTVEYYNKLPSVSNVDIAIILDPMIATAGTSIACANILKDWGMNECNIKFVSICCFKEGIDVLQQAYPLTQIYTAVIDEALDMNGFVLPGLGDAGDRLFHT